MAGRSSNTTARTDATAVGSQKAMATEIGEPSIAVETRAMMIPVTNLLWLGSTTLASSLIISPHSTPCSESSPTESRINARIPRQPAASPAHIR